MARFKYRMQNILNIKEKLENLAKMEYAIARNKLTEEEELLLNIRQRKDLYLEQAIHLRTAILNVRDINENKEAIIIIDGYIEKQILEVKVAEKNLRQAKNKLQEEMRERKTHEKLREKAFEEFLLEEKSQEGKEIDELVSYTYGQKLGG